MSWRTWERIADALDDLAPTTAAEVVLVTGLDKRTIYPTLRRMRAAGMVREVGSIATGGRPAALWDLA